jgi:hypothetical protein
MPTGSAPMWTLVLNVLCPLVTYQVLTRQGASEVTALCVASVFPVLGVLRGWRTAQRLDGLSAVSLLFIAASLVVGILANSPTVIILQGPAGTAAIALGVLASLLLPRPLLFYVTRQFAAPESAEAERFDRLWANVRFRSSQRVLTAVCGGGLMADAVIRAVLALTLPVSTFLLISPGVDFVVAFGLIRWGSGFARQAIHSASTSASR